MTKYTVKNTTADRAFSLLYQGLLPAISGKKLVPIYAGEFYTLYQVTHSTVIEIEGNLTWLSLFLYCTDSDAIFE